MNYYSLFYWLVVADNARVFFGWGIGIFMIGAAISTLYYWDDDTQNDPNFTKEGLRMIRWTYSLSILFWCLFLFTPSKKDSLLIVAGGGALNFLTTDSSAKQIPHELSRFLVTEIRNLSADAEVDLQLKDQKQRVIEQAKEMSKEELLNKIQTDTSFVNALK